MANSTFDPRQQDDEQDEAFKSELDALPTTEPDRAVPDSFKHDPVYGRSGNAPSSRSRGRPEGLGAPNTSTDDSGSENTQDDLAQSEASAEGFKYSGGGGQHENQVGRGHKDSSGKPRMLSNGSKNRRKWIAGGGLAGGVLIVSVVSMLSFLNAFKLDDVMSNIDQAAFSRMDAATQRRSDRWIQAYLTIRLMQFTGTSGADPDSEYFRATKVDTNNPIRDWYHTLKVSGFERDLAKQGIILTNQDTTSEDGKRKIVFTTLYVDGQQFGGLTAKEVRKGDIIQRIRTDPTIIKNISDTVDLTAAGGNKEARAKLKQTVHDLMPEANVIKRRQTRKSLQNMLGIRNWRFFETTRDKSAQKKIDIRNKVITTAIPESTKSGKFLRCFFGITSCTFSEDPSSPENQSEATLTGDTADNPNNPSASAEVTDPATGKKVEIKTIDYTNSKEVLTGILSKATGVVGGLNLISTLDMISSVDNHITNNDLSKGVAVARGAQAAGLYQVFETARDQMKTGQLTGDEVNKLMPIIGTVASSDAWVKGVNGTGNASLTDTQASANYCSAKHQKAIENDPIQSNKEFAFLCPDKQIGGSSNAKSLENGYKRGPGVVAHRIVQAYDSVRHAPIIGDIVNFAQQIVGSITGKVSDVLLSTLGIKGDVQTAIQYLIVQLASFLGGGPIMNGAESGGQYFNWMLQGGAYTAESSARYMGASLTNPVSQKQAQDTLAEYQGERLVASSTLDKYLSPHNINSPVNHLAFAMTQTSFSDLGSKFTNFSSVFKNVGSALTLPFSHQALATPTDNGYRAAKLAGIQTYDFHCDNLDPLTETPQTVTNIQQVFPGQVPDGDLTWELISNSTDWYNYLYSKAGDNDTTALQVYNCGLTDNAVRGGVGYKYGYTKDNGLEDGSSQSSSTGPTDTTPSPPPSQISGDFPAACTPPSPIPAIKAYDWPIKPFDKQHPVRGNFNDPRFSGSKDVDTADSTSFHFGVDVAAPDGTPVYAIEAGKVDLSGGQSVAIVSADKMLDYWHIDYTGILSNGQQVSQHQLIGHIAKNWGHVHLAESHRDADGKVYYVNPLRSGALMPYQDNGTPVIKSLDATATGKNTSLNILSGYVDLTVNAYDNPPMAPPSPWNKSVVTPALVQWSIEDDSGKSIMGTRTAEDFSQALCLADIFDQIYASGTLQNGPPTIGNYNLYLVKKWDTTKMQNGQYKITLEVKDYRGNAAQKSFNLSVNN